VKLPTSNAFEVKPPPGPDEVKNIYTAWMQEELRQHPGAVCIMPLLNFDELYGPSYNGMNGAFQPIRHAYERVNLDPARVYLIGHGMAGHATWNLGLHFTTYFAAINPLAGACTGDWQRMRLMNLRNVLPVVWHDADDDILKVDFSRQIVKAIRGLKLDVEYDETKGQGHAPAPETYERNYQKTTARVRELYPAEVYLQSNRPDVMFNRIDWVQVYQPLTPGKESRLLFRHGTGYMTVTNFPWSIQAVRPGRNKVEAVTKNVATMRFYLNDQTVNFKEPVTVIVNKKPRFEGMVKPSVDVMLKDQLVLGRGWRYFTGVVDIDLAPPATQPTTQPATTRPADTRPSR
jgi:predicted esterase